jgi:hypothetical protein
MSHYFSDMRAMAHQISQVGNNGERTVISNSVQIHEVTITAVQFSVLIYLAENHFYILGFRTTSGTEFRFNDKTINRQQRATNLGLGCSYVGTKSLGIFNSEDATQLATRGSDSLSSAIKELAQFAGGAAEQIRLSLAMIVFYLAESLRFVKIFGRMVSVSKGENAFTFKEFKTLVQNWESLSTSTNQPPGTSKADVYILQA